MSKRALKRGKDRCTSAKYAWNQLREVRPRLNSIRQICSTLGAETPPIPPFRDSARDFNTVTGEESRRRPYPFAAPKSPLQLICRVEPDPSEKEIREFEDQVVKTWTQNCPTTDAAPALQAD